MIALPSPCRILHEIPYDFICADIESIKPVRVGDKIVRRGHLFLFDIPQDFIEGAFPKATEKFFHTALTLNVLGFTLDSDEKLRVLCPQVLAEGHAVPHGRFFT